MSRWRKSCYLIYCGWRGWCGKLTIALLLVVGHARVSPAVWSILGCVFHTQPGSLALTVFFAYLFQCTSIFFVSANRGGIWLGRPDASFFGIWGVANMLLVLGLNLVAAVVAPLVMFLTARVTNQLIDKADQARSAAFYARVLHCAPSLDVPGMTEFRLSAACVLGLMPEAGIKRLLGSPLPDPAQAAGIPRAELYLRVANALEYHRRALEAGAIELSEPRDRDWGDRVAYALDPDGHVLAFAEKQVANLADAGPE